MRVIHLLRKPLGESSVAANVLAHGTGALHIDVCRIPVTDEAYAKNCSGDRGHADNRSRDLGFALGCGRANSGGRWPANLVLEHKPGCRCTDVQRIAAWDCQSDCPVADLDSQQASAGAAAPVRGTEPSDPVEQDRIYKPRARVRGAFHADSGGASRFYKQVQHRTNED